MKKEESVGLQRTFSRDTIETPRILSSAVDTMRKVPCPHGIREIVQKLQEVIDKQYTVPSPRFRRNVSNTTRHQARPTILASRLLRTEDLLEQSFLLLLLIWGPSEHPVEVKVVLLSVMFVFRQSVD